MCRSDGCAYGCDIHTLCYIFEVKTGDIITFAQFKEVDLLSKTRDDAESGDEYDDHSTMPPLSSEEEMDVMSSGDEYDA